MHPTAIHAAKRKVLQLPQECCLHVFSCSCPNDKGIGPPLTCDGICLVPWLLLHPPPGRLGRLLLARLGLIRCSFLSRVCVRACVQRAPPRSRLQEATQDQVLCLRVQLGTMRAYMICNEFYSAVHAELMSSSGGRHHRRQLLGQLSWCCGEIHTLPLVGRVSSFGLDATPRRFCCAASGTSCTSRLWPTAATPPLQTCSVRQSIRLTASTDSI